MGTVKIEKSESGSYDSNNSDDEKLELLGVLLGENVYDMASYLRKCFEEQNGVGFNSAGAYREGNEVEISDLIPSGDGEDPYSFRMPYDKFMKMIDQWEVAFAGCPDEVIIHMDDDYNFTFERITKEGWTPGQMGPQ